MITSGSVMARIVGSVGRQIDKSGRFKNKVGSRTSEMRSRTSIFSGIMAQKSNISLVVFSIVLVHLVVTASANFNYGKFADIQVCGNDNKCRVW